jgi:iron(III) transport system substrate-binding protein
MRLIRPAAIAALAVLSLAAVGCGTGGDDTDAITVYSGRSEELVGPIISQFTERTGIQVNVRYGSTSELAAQILEEGSNSPADVFFAQDAGALGAVAAVGQFAELPTSILDQVPPRFRSPEGLWVGVSGRARVVVYNTNNVTEADLPDDLTGFTEPEWRGRVGWAPANGSFQAFVTALRVLEGDEAAGAWLSDMRANNVQAYENNIAILTAVANGEIDAGFVNHYYVNPYLQENPNAPVALHFGSGEGADALVNVAGAGVLASARNADGAQQFIDFLLSEQAQTYFAEETSEYPLVPGVPGPANLPPLTDLRTPDIDLSRLEDLQGTLELLRTNNVL